MRSKHNLKKSADLSKPWGRFFQILCVSQNVRTLTAIMIKTFCVFFNFLNLNKFFLRVSIDDFMKWKWLKLLSTHNSKIQTYEWVKVCLQFFDMWYYLVEILWKIVLINWPYTQNRPYSRIDTHSITKPYKALSIHLQNTAAWK